MMQNTNVAQVTGLGVITSLGAGVASFAHALKNGVSGISRREGKIPVLGGFLPDGAFEDRVATLSLPETWARKMLRLMCRAPYSVQVSALACMAAWRSAGFLERAPVDPTRVGVVVAGQNISAGFQFRQAERFRAEPEYLPASYGLHFLDTDQVGCLSELIDACGEGCTTGGASASGNLALITGLRLIRQNLVDVCAVVGALADLSPLESHAFQQMGAMRRPDLAANPGRVCRPFDANRAGFVYGQGAGCLILENPGLARKRGAPDGGSILGGAVCLDGNRSSDLSSAGVARAMRGAIQAGGVTVDQIDYINAHAGGSVSGDEREVAGIKRVLGGRTGQVWLNSTKELTGHCLWAAGIVEAAAVLLQMNEGFLHPNPNLEQPLDPDCRFVGPQTREVRCRTALSNSQGFGGFNTSIVLRASGPS